MEFLKEQELNKLLSYVYFRDATLIRRACAGLGTDDTLLISILTRRSKEQLIHINQSFLSLYKSTIKEVIYNDCGGNYKKFLIYLVESRGEYLSERVKEAMSGLGSDKTLINELICLSTKKVQEMKQFYEKSNDSSLSDKLRSELSGEHEALIMNLLLRGRGDSPIDINLANDQAERIHNTIERGGGMFGGLDDTSQRSVRISFIYSFLNLILTIFFLYRLEVFFVKHLHNNVKQLNV